MDYFKSWSVLIGLVIPFVGVVGGVVVLSQSRALILGLPAVFAWIFLWFILTAVCLGICWHFFDRNYHEEMERIEESERGKGRS